MISTSFDGPFAWWQKLSQVRVRVKARIRIRVRVRSISMIFSHKP
jgi:hypothetical protein